MSVLSKLKLPLVTWLAPGLVLTAGLLALTYWLKVGKADPATLLYGQVFTSTSRTLHPVLVVVLHGDAPFTKPSYQYTFAQRLAQQTPDVVAVALLRPGYTDPAGHHSAGQRGWTTGDNYTPAIVQAIANTIQDLTKRYHPRRVVLAGHSGGAVLAANVTSQYSSLIQAALLVSCPCDVDAFREHMAAYEGSWLWQLPVKRLSPIELVSQLRPSTSISLVTGRADSIALPLYSYTYAAQLKKRKLPVQVVELAHQGHEILLRPEVMAQLKRLLQVDSSTKLQSIQR